LFICPGFTFLLFGGSFVVGRGPLGWGIIRTLPLVLLSDGAEGGGIRERGQGRLDRSRTRDLFVYHMNTAIQKSEVKSKY
jgi:hypothetical protein